MSKTITKVNFHPYMDDMTVVLEREFTSKDGVKLARVKDLKDRGATVPVEWLQKKTKVNEGPPEPPNGTFVLLSWGPLAQRNDDLYEQHADDAVFVGGPWFLVTPNRPDDERLIGHSWETMNAGGNAARIVDYDKLS